MVSRLLILITALCLAACSPPTQDDAAPHTSSGETLRLYAASNEVRAFANPVGFRFPEGVSLEQSFDRQSGALLSDEEAEVVAGSVTVLPPPDAVAACAHVWRHVFVFYDVEGAPLGALAYCQECGAVIVLGSEDPGVGLDRLGYDGPALDRIIAAHDLAVEPEYPE